MNYTLYYRKRSSFRLWMGISRSNKSQIVEDCKEFKKLHSGLECGYIVD